MNLITLDFVLVVAAYLQEQAAAYRLPSVKTSNPASPPASLLVRHYD
jgi:hypothetical protein